MLAALLLILMLIVFFTLQILNNLSKKMSRWRCVGDIWRRLEDFFSVTSFVFQDVFKTCLQSVFMKTSRIWRLASMSWRFHANTSSRRLQDVLKTSWKMKNCNSEDVFKTSWEKKNICWDLATETLLSEIKTMAKLWKGT